MAAAVQGGDRKIFLASATSPRWKLEELPGRVSVPAGRCERSTGRAEGDVEFQLSAALHRRRGIQERRDSELQAGVGTADPVEHFTIGNVGFYNNTGRTEVDPIPTDSEATTAGIRYRFGAYPFLEPSEMRGFGFIRYRNVDPKIEDNCWMFNPRTRHTTARPPTNSRTSWV